MREVLKGVNNLKVKRTYGAQAWLVVMMEAICTLHGWSAGVGLVGDVAIMVEFSARR